MEFSKEEKAMLVNALGARAVTILQDTGFAGLKVGGESSLSKLSPQELRTAMGGTLIGIGLALTDAQHMFERAAEVCREIVAREIGDRDLKPPPAQWARTLVDRAAWPVVDGKTGCTYASAAAAADATGRTERQVRNSCYHSPGRFSWEQKNEGA